MDISEVFDVQQTIIELQAKVINDLLLTVMQHVTTDEADNMKCVGHIKEAEKLKSEIDVE
jgi:hypothetical protein